LNDLYVINYLRFNHFFHVIYVKINLVKKIFICVNLEIKICENNEFKIDQNDKIKFEKFELINVKIEIQNYVLSE